MQKYNPSKIEKKWQKIWEKENQYLVPDVPTDASKKNYYVLSEFPYPSGNLHIGHWLAFSVPDIFARYKRMQGFNVLYPIGFDAFGLPAENAAIKRNLQPKDWTESNIKYMTKQLKSMGAMFDWSRVVRTIDPDYYRWTQWIFLQFYKKGLAYRAKTLANWCPKDKTVLANEQVIQKEIEGRQVNICERCDSEVEQKHIEQWMFKITEYADRLVDDLEKMDWPETTKSAQRNWIGRSRGAEIDFAVAGTDKKITVFTTRADTLAGVVFVVLAPDHQLVKELAPLARNYQAVKEYVEISTVKTERERLIDAKEKTGVPLEGVIALNPLTGDKVQVWIGDYVLVSYGTGAVMGVPAHDQRDFELAKKYNLPMKVVIKSTAGDPDPATWQKAYGDDGELISSLQFSGLPSGEAREKIVAFLEAAGSGRVKTQYRLRDWLLSRQRYWGVPIPMVRCDDCGYQPVPEDTLPVKLPKLENYLPADDPARGGQAASPLYKAEKWLNVKCPKCKKPAERETDTMDTFVDSSWYFIRYLNPNFTEGLADPENIRRWLPVDVYIGGAEHNTMHLLYSRFFAKALKDCGVLEFDEPFTIRRNHGIVLGPDGQKMSKSKGNVVDPDDLVAKYGADTVRMYLAFMAPYDQGGPWDPQGINGIARFLNRVWVMCHEHKKAAERAKPLPPLSDDALQKLNVDLHQAIKKVGDDIEALSFNTAVSALMVLSNKIHEVADHYVVPPEFYSTLLRLLAPFAPHMAEDVWKKLFASSEMGSIHGALWPEYDPALLETQNIQMVVQIGGKTRGTLECPRTATQNEVQEKVLADIRFSKFLEQKEIRKIIFVPGKIINIVI